MGKRERNEFMGRLAAAVRQAVTPERVTLQWSEDYDITTRKCNVTLDVGVALQDVMAAAFADVRDWPESVGMVGVSFDWSGQRFVPTLTGPQPECGDEDCSVCNGEDYGDSDCGDGSPADGGRGAVGAI